MSKHWIKPLVTVIRTSNLVKNIQTTHTKHLASLWTHGAAGPAPHAASSPDLTSPHSTCIQSTELKHTLNIKHFSLDYYPSRTLWSNKNNFNCAWIKKNQMWFFKCASFKIIQLRFLKCDFSKLLLLQHNLIKYVFRFAFNHQKMCYTLRINQAPSLSLSSSDML